MEVWTKILLQVSQTLLDVTARDSARAQQHVAMEHPSDLIILVRKRCAVM